MIFVLIIKESYAMDVQNVIITTKYMTDIAYLYQIIGIMIKISLNLQLNLIKI